MSLMCNFVVSKAAVETAHRIEFDTYFARELAALERFADEGLVELSADRIGVTPKGKLLVRAIAMTFDRYLQHDERVRRYSKIV